MKFNQKMYSDSETVTKLSCGRTKTTAIVQNMLAPFSVELLRKEMGNSFFSVAIDASNKGNRKPFPVCIRNFNPNLGLQDSLLDFYDDGNETSSAICEKLKQVMQRHFFSYGKYVDRGKIGSPSKIEF